MNEYVKQLAERLGIPLALSDGQPDEKATAGLIQGKLDEMTTAKTSMDAFLQLHDAKDLETVTGKIKGMVPAAELTALNDRLAGIEAEKAVAEATLSLPLSSRSSMPSWMTSV